MGSVRLDRSHRHNRVEGVPWLAQSDGSVHRKGLGWTLTLVETPGALTINDLITIMPPMIPAEAPSVTVSNPGRMLCSAEDAGSFSYCGNTKADYVGPFTLNTTCPKGFYDPIYGGTCWKCPEDDGSGGWIRSLDAVDKERPPAGDLQKKL